VFGIIKIAMTALVSILLLVVPSVGAQVPAKGDRQAPISGDRVRSLLRDMAVNFTEDSSGGSSDIGIQLPGHVIRLRYRVDGLSLGVCYEGGVEPIKANQWNRQHFSTRVAPDEKGCAALEADATFGGGATDQMIREFVRQFCTAVVVFDRFLTLGRDQELQAQAPAGVPARRARVPAPQAMAWSQPEASARAVECESTPGLLKISANVLLKHDPKQWRVVASEGDGLFAFEHAAGGRAVVLIERTAVPLDSIEDVALANAQSVDPQAKVVFRNRPWVNGVATWFLRIEATVDAVPMVYWGHFYAGDGGTIQVVTYAEKSRYREYEQRLTEFLNGLTVSR
jgi:hypothetical protein